MMLSQAVHFSRTLAAIPRQSKKEMGEKRVLETEFRFGLKLESPCPTPKVTPVVRSSPKLKA